MAVMYIYVDWMKCRLCKRTNCLFYAFNDKRGKNINNPKVSPTVCKLCFLEDCSIKNIRYYSNNKQKELMRRKIDKIEDKEKWAEYHRKKNKEHRDRIKNNNMYLMEGI